MTQDTNWTVRNLDGTHVRKTPLWLEYEVAGSVVGENFPLDEMNADEVFREYVRQFEAGLLDNDPGLPAGYAFITWTVVGPDFGPELAPFQPNRWADARDEENYLTFCAWPVNESTGERADFLKLPVRSMRWNRDHTDRGGFIEEATGWKPAPLQPCVWLPGLLEAHERAKVSQV